MDCLNHEEMTFFLHFQFIFGIKITSVFIKDQNEEFPKKEH
jgi:hypothetical protein